ncbi:hypothetical protein BC828DRAFT_224890 [Blastocladiella britannica]|nr:hypothetical protein BC828DRAFT_224890 [Blastocladiella britannica]
MPWFAAFTKLDEKGLPTVPLIACIQLLERGCELTVGRKACDFVFVDHTVSRHQLRLVIEDGDDEGNLVIVEESKKLTTSIDGKIVSGRLVVRDTATVHIGKAGTTIQLLRLPMTAQLDPALTPSERDTAIETLAGLGATVSSPGRTTASPATHYMSNARPASIAALMARARGLYVTPLTKLRDFEALTQRTDLVGPLCDIGPVLAAQLTLGSAAPLNSALLQQRKICLDRIAADESEAFANLIQLLDGVVVHSPALADLVLDTSDKRAEFLASLDRNIAPPSSTGGSSATGIQALRRPLLLGSTQAGRSARPPGASASGSLGARSLLHMLSGGGGGGNLNQGSALTSSTQLAAASQLSGPSSLAASVSHGRNPGGGGGSLFGGQTPSRSFRVPPGSQQPPSTPSSTPTLSQTVSLAAQLGTKRSLKDIGLPTPVRTRTILEPTVEELSDPDEEVDSRLSSLESDAGGDGAAVKQENAAREKVAEEDAPPPLTSGNGEELPVKADDRVVLFVALTTSRRVSDTPTRSDDGRTSTVKDFKRFRKGGSGAARRGTLPNILPVCLAGGADGSAGRTTATTSTNNFTSQFTATMEPTRSLGSFDDDEHRATVSPTLHNSVVLPAPTIPGAPRNHKRTRAGRRAALLSDDEGEGGDDLAAASQALDMFAFAPPSQQRRRRFMDLDDADDDDDDDSYTARSPSPPPAPMAPNARRAARKRLLDSP